MIGRLRHFIFFMRVTPITSIGTTLPILLPRGTVSQNISTGGSRFPPGGI